MFILDKQLTPYWVPFLFAFNYGNWEKAKNGAPIKLPTIFKHSELKPYSDQGDEGIGEITRTDYIAVYHFLTIA